MVQALAIISGIVLDPSGRPVAQARVYFMSTPMMSPDIAMLTNNDGEFTLAVMSEGTYKIGITADGYAQTYSTVVVMGRQEIKLLLKLSDGE